MQRREGPFKLLPLTVVLLTSEERALGTELAPAQSVVSNDGHSLSSLNQHRPCPHCTCLPPQPQPGNGLIQALTWIGPCLPGQLPPR